MVGNEGLKSIGNIWRKPGAKGDPASHSEDFCFRSPLET